MRREAQSQLRWQSSYTCPFWAYFFCTWCTLPWWNLSWRDVSLDIHSSYRAMKTLETTSLLQTPMTCWPVRGAAPTCWTKWNTPSSAGSSRSRSSASLSLTATWCWAKWGSGKELQACGLVERAEWSLPDPANSEEFSWMICYWFKKTN